MRTPKHIGRRGACMLSLAVTSAAIGWTNITQPPASLRHLVLFSDVPPWVLGVWWLLPAFLLAVAALVDRESKWDGPALLISYLSTAFWGAAYVGSAILYGDQPVGISFRTAAVYWGFSAVIVIISGWPEPAPPVSLDDERSRTP